MSGGSYGTPKFGRRLNAQRMAVAPNGAPTCAAEAYYS